MTLQLSHTHSHAHTAQRNSLGTILAITRSKSHLGNPVPCCPISIPALSKPQSQSLSLRSQVRFPHAFPGAALHRKREVSDKASYFSLSGQEANRKLRRCASCCTAREIHDKAHGQTGGVTGAGLQKTSGATDCHSASRLRQAGEQGERPAGGSSVQHTELSLPETASRTLRNRTPALPAGTVCWRRGERPVSCLRKQSCPVSEREAD